jgi:Ca-activated chloride channel homolog
MRDKFKMAREAASQLLGQLTADDEAFVVTVSNRAELRQDFTSNTGEIADALVFINPDGSTSLLDGVNLGLDHLKKAHTPRKALVVVSDGGDNNSRYTLHELLSKATEADILIYTICLFQDPQTKEELAGPGLLADLAQKTGGITFFVKDREINSLGQVMGTIGVTLHNQYVLGYYPPENGPAGKYRKIKVQLLLPKGMPEMHIYARTGYYAP